MSSISWPDEISLPKEYPSDFEITCRVVMPTMLALRNVF